ncbi:MAG TPA: tRNA (adenosine(37)-N6)-dimethylallyltransferase MiaA [Marinagarivorans sp.]
MARPRVLTLMGPTAAGKTDLAMALVEHCNAEIISVDSALVYRGMDIGSAKPSADELARAPHRLIDILDPSESYNAADFCKDAAWHIEDILTKGKTPLLVGGTMLYFKALLEGLSDMPATNDAVRAEIEQLASQHGWPYVHAVLAKADPACAAKLHPNHSQRISRALEVYRSSGIPMSRWQVGQQEGLQRKYQWLQLAIAPKERQILHQRIALRFRKMVAEGFLDEVENLMAREDLSLDTPAMRAVGYRQAWQYLAGHYDRETFIEKGIVATRQLAKRQLTWLRGWHDLSWVYTQDDAGEMLSSDEILAKALKLVAARTI